MRFFFPALIAFCFVSFFTVSANEGKTVIYEIDMNREINTTAWIHFSKGLTEAQEKKAKAVILHLNTYGGAVTDADSIRSAILYSPIPVYVFIDNNAASAGALIAIACKGIYMRKGANIGAATVVDQTGTEMPDKYQSYMRATIRSTAEAQGKDTIMTANDTLYKWKRDPNIAEAMVDERISIPGIVDSGKVLTLTTDEALKLGYCDGITESVNEVIIQYLKYPEYELHVFQPTVYDNVKGFLLNPAFQAILIMIIIAGIYFELQSPGIGFPTFAALAAAVLYFSPLYLDGMAQHWEIILFFIGLILIAIEIFVIPGFGITGISGIIIVASGLTLSLINNDLFSFEGVTIPDLSRSVLTVLSGILLGFIAMLYLSSRIGEPGIFRKIALTNDLETSFAVDMDNKRFVGETGEALTVLRPSGKVKIGNEVYDAVSDGSFIDKGDQVIITQFKNAQLYVEKTLS